MVSPEVFQFLKELKKNNHKDWFDANRATYHNIRDEFEHVVNLVIGEIAMFDKFSAQTTARASMFRINRDIRFSNDKTPYKTNMGAYIANGGRKSVYAGYYVHVEPGACFLSGGIYMPSASVLKAIRTEIHENSDEFKNILNAPDFIKHFKGGLWGERLKTAPKGFPKDSDDIGLLRYKHYAVIKDESDHVYTQPSFLKEIRDVFQTAFPFNAFLNSAVENMTK